MLIQFSIRWTCKLMFKDPFDNLKWQNLLEEVTELQSAADVVQSSST